MLKQRNSETAKRRQVKVMQAAILRLTPIAFPLAMILTALRIMKTNGFSQRQECRDDDFQRVLSMIRMLVRHSSHVFSELPAINKSAKPKDSKEQFLEMLPEKFNRQDYFDLGRSLSISAKTTHRKFHIRQFTF